jgi:hypothetical protein
MTSMADARLLKRELLLDEPKTIRPRSPDDARRVPARLALCRYTP